MLDNYNDKCYICNIWYMVMVYIYIILLYIYDNYNDNIAIYHDNSSIYI